MKTKINKHKKVTNAINFVSYFKDENPNLDGIGSYIKSNKDIAQILSERLSDRQRVAEKLSVVEEIEASKSENISKIIHKREIRLKKQKTLRNWRIVGGSIAAAILFLSFMIYNQSSNNTPIVAQVEVIKEYSKPMLILQSGEAISVADEQQVNKIEDNIERIVASNKLTYSAKNKIDTLIYNKLVIPSQNTYTVILSDSTEVILNANSTLEYPVEFIGDNRSVRLSGEAYFKVKKSNKPFIVDVNRSSYVKVFGTEFNVNARNTELVKTILVEGSVGVGATNREPIMIEPNQLVSVNLDDYSCKIENIDTNKYLGWIDGNINANEVSMVEVLEMVESWYGVRFKYNIKDISEIELSFSISNSNPIEEIIKVISFASEKEIVLTLNENVYEIE